MDNDSSGTTPPGLPGLPEHVLQEKFIESPQQQLVLERRAVGKFLKGDTTPDVADVEHWIAQNIVSTLVTKFEHGQPGQHLYILGDGQTTLKHGTSIFMTGGADLLLAASQVYHFVGYAQSPVVFYQVIDTGGGGGGGAVDSVFGRVGVVTALQADYDAFFLTPAEGNAAYSALGHIHDDRYFTEAESDARFAPIVHTHDDRYFTEAESDARFAAIAHTHPAADIVSGILDVARIPDLNASKITAGTMATARLGSGTADATTFLRGDSTWAVPPGGGGGGGVDGTGAANRYARWFDSNTIESAYLVDSGGNVQLVNDSDDAFFEFQPGNVTPGQSATNPGWMIGAEDASGDLFIRSRWTGNALYEIAANEAAHYFAGAGAVYAELRHASLSLPRDGTNIWIGRRTADNFQIRFNDDGADTQLDGALPSWAVTIGEGATDNFAIYRMAAGGGGGYVGFWKLNNVGHWTPGTDAARDIGAAALRVRTVYAQQVADGSTGTMLSSAGTVAQIAAGSAWSQLNFYTGATARWHITSSGHMLPVADNTYDIGSGALSVRDIFLDGDLWYRGQKQAHTIETWRNSDQSNNTTTLANVTGMTFATEAGRKYAFTFLLGYTSAALTTGIGVDLLVTGVGTVEYGVTIYGFAADGGGAAWHGTGHLSGDLVMSTASVNVGHTHMIVIQGFYICGTAGDVQLRFRSEVAGSAVVIKDGSTMLVNVHEP